MRNRFTTRNQWFTETIETIRTSGLTLIISIIRFFKTYTAEFGINIAHILQPVVISYSKHFKRSVLPDKLFTHQAILRLKFRTFNP
ncbi:MAG: hypothetical protein LCH44_13745 [Bacteroidetes bacterium]|nr:hypothetical protein [Bacteroidota bacterium]